MYAKQDALTLAYRCERFDWASSYLKTRLVRSLFDGRDWIPISPFSNRGQASMYSQDLSDHPAGLANLPKRSTHGLRSIYHFGKPLKSRHVRLHLLGGLIQNLGTMVTCHKPYLLEPLASRSIVDQWLLQIAHRRPNQH